MPKKEPEVVKHTVHTDALETLGNLIDASQARDAIHLAVEPVVAGEVLVPGQHVGLSSDKKAVTEGVKFVGIVDPFLKTHVLPDQMFWLVVYPREITSLRHVWSHPDFEVLQIDAGVLGQKQEAAKTWIENYAQELSGYEYGGDNPADEDDTYHEVTYQELMETAETHCTGTSKYGGDYVVKGGMLEGVGTNPEFWEHFKTLTGKEPVGDDKKPNFFSCSC
jgi:hypothetical protein